MCLPLDIIIDLRTSKGLGMYGIAEQEGFIDILGTVPIRRDLHLWVLTFGASTMFTPALHERLFLVAGTRRYLRMDNTTLHILLYSTAVMRAALMLLRACHNSLHGLTLQQTIRQHCDYKRRPYLVFDLMASM